MKILHLIWLYGIIGLAAYGQTPPLMTNNIPVELARFVASQHVHRNNPPFAWRSVDHMVLHNIEGEVTGYAFVFAKADAKLRSSADLERHIQEKATLLREAGEKSTAARPNERADGQTPAAVVEAEESLYSFNDLATVITGATSDSPLILRHFRGIPEFWVDARTLGSATLVGISGKSQRVSGAIMITPMDFRLAVSETEEGDSITGGLRVAQAVTIPEFSKLLNIHGKKFDDLSMVRKVSQDVEARKQQRLSTLKPADRQKYVQAQQDRSRALAGEWEQYRQSWVRAEVERGAAR